MVKVGDFRFGRYAAQMFAFLLFFLAALALTRLLYEAAFPRLLWLARPLPVLLLALLTAIGGWAVVSKWRGARGERREARFSVWALTPLLLNLPTVLDPVIDLAGSRLLFTASFWFTAVLLARCTVQERSWRWLGVIFIIAALLPVYLLTMPDTVGSADTFEFQVVIPQLGIAHPTGYPLYLLLGRLFTLLPLGSVAWRANLASAVFALLAVLLVNAGVRRLLGRPVPALLAAVVLGLTPVFWSQAIEAEVYALHALIVAAALWLMVEIVSGGKGRVASGGWRVVILLAFVIGLGLANHLTSLFLIPPAVLAVLLAYGRQLRQQSLAENLLLLLKVLAAFLLPLVLYLYLPLRWQAVNGEPMGLGRFVEWVIGGRFQGALQLTAWLNDITRYEVVGRLLLNNWGWINLGLILLGLIYLGWHKWRMALVLLVTWLGFIFYALNYYVPDLAVFIIPAHVVMALFWGAGATAVLSGAGWLSRKGNWPGLRVPLENILLVLLLLPSLWQVTQTWPEMQGGDNRDLLQWGEGTLAMPLDVGAALLADSEKIAPLYYLQQAEGVRPDLEIMVLPDEAAYRTELDARIAAGQTVYLARLLPGLEGVYHLRSVGPLIEVSGEPLISLPEGTELVDLEVGPLHLAGYSVQKQSAVDPLATGVTLFWRADDPMTEPMFVYVRWAGEGFVGEPAVRSGQHPVGNTYPTVAWQAGEIVPDFHLLPWPVGDEEQELDLEVALGPAFAVAEDLLWQKVGKVTLPPAEGLELERPLRAQNGRVLLNGVQFPTEIRPQKPLPIVLSGYGTDVRDLQFSLQAGEEAGDVLYRGTTVGAVGNEPPAFVTATEVDTDLPSGRYYLMSEDAGETAVCGWMAPATTACSLGEVTISGVPIPKGATNFEDKIALLNIELPQIELQPGGQLPVNLRWQSLGPIDEDYTVFLQVLDARDRIVGQVDVWPLQGTYPTSHWAQAEIIDDPHLIQLDGQLEPGPYRLQIGWYLLSTLRRLSVLDENGLAVDDKVILNELVVP